MKKIYLLLAIITTTIGQAQVPNPGFEETISDGVTLKNWGTFFPSNIIIDVNTGEIITDDIIFQNGTGFSSPVGNCVTGSWSMMLTNAFNATQNVVIPGKASIFNDAESETHTGWNDGYPIAPGTIIDRLGFDYQFFPAGDNDAAEATLELYGESGEMVGKASIPISGFTADFAYVYSTVQFTSNETPVLMRLEFNMAPDGSTPTFGSMLLVDNVIVNGMPLGVNTSSQSLFTVYPTLADNEINIMKSTEVNNDTYTMTISDANGKTVKQQSISINDNPATMDVSQLTSGVYFLRAESGNASSVTRFIKK